jgi:hypothetical protein
VSIQMSMTVSPDHTRAAIRTHSTSPAQKTTRATVFSHLA